jgi:uncharacterized tellurite resistance protein B-like protein
MSDLPRHPALDLPEAERVDYLCVVASVACADKTVDPTELDKLRGLCAALEVGGEGAERVVAAASAPDPARIARILKRMSRGSHRFALLTDVTVMAFADGRVASGEAEEIARFARVLQLSTGHAVLIGRYVENTLRAEPGDKLSQDLADQLASLPAGVPNDGVVRALFARFRGGKSPSDNLWLRGG